MHRNVHKTLRFVVLKHKYQNIVKWLKFLSCSCFVIWPSNLPAYWRFILVRQRRGYIVVTLLKRRLQVEVKEAGRQVRLTQSMWTDSAPWNSPFSRHNQSKININSHINTTLSISFLNSLRSSSQSPSIKWNSHQIWNAASIKTDLVFCTKGCRWKAGFGPCPQTQSKLCIPKAEWA